MKKQRVAVPVAILWTTPESVRHIDKAVIDEQPDLCKWLMTMSQEQTIALCSEKRIQSQILFGDEVAVERICGSWAEVYVPGQYSAKDVRGYPGWTPVAHLTQSPMGTNGPRVMIQSKTAAFHLLHRDVQLDLSFATFLPLIEENDMDVLVDSPIGPGVVNKNDVLIPKKRHLHTGSEIVENAKRFLGLPYLWAGLSAYGFDCSGFSYAMLRAGGYVIPRDAADQAIHGRDVPLTDARPGDLLFFADNQGKGAVHHVGIYTGKDTMIHSPTPGACVCLTQIGKTKYKAELCALKRYWKD